MKATLSKSQIDTGAALLDALSRAGIVVGVALWEHHDGDDVWRLFVEAIPPESEDHSAVTRAIAAAVNAQVPDAALRGDVHALLASDVDVGVVGSPLGAHYRRGAPKTKTRLHDHACGRERHSGLYVYRLA